MRVMGLDLSGSSGWSIVTDTPELKPECYGVIALSQPAKNYLPHPFGYWLAASEIAFQIYNKVLELNPDVIVVEETNGGGRGNRFSQKILEYIHFAILEYLSKLNIPIKYINTVDWRKTIGSHLSKEDKKINAKVSQLKRKCTTNGVLNIKEFNKEKKKLGVRGKVNKKHVTIRLVNSMWNLGLKAGQDDVSDSLALCLAYFSGTPFCNGSK